MAGSSYSHTTRATGLVLTASIYNTDHTNHITSLTPATMDDYSASVAEMRTQTDPFPASATSQATSMAGELARMRYQLDLIIGKTYWYEVPAASLAEVVTGGFVWAMDGVLIINAAGDTEHDIDVDFDALTVSDNGDPDGTLKLIANGNYTALIDASAGLNALDTGTPANDTVYFIWVVSKDAGATPGVLISLTSTFGSLTMPTDYTMGRLVGAIHTDGSANIRNFTHQKGGNFFRYDDPIQDVDDNTITANTAETATLSVPPNTLAQVILYVTNSAQVASATIFPMGAADDTTNPDESAVDGDASGGGYGSGQAIVPVDASSQCEYMADEGSGVTTVKVNTLGFWFYA